MVMGSHGIPPRRAFCARIRRGMEPLIRFDQVSFSYKTGESAGSLVIEAVRQVSLAIEEGEFAAVVGANGSGKSTFARLASALLLPSEGRVRLSGYDTRESAHRARVSAGIGVVFQYPEDQIVGMTVEEDAAFGPENLGLPAAEIRERVEDALREVGMWEHRLRPPNMLSAGQTQRLALAGVLAMRPRCILFDEASTMLDPSGRRHLMEVMKRLNQAGITVVYITHFMEEAAQAKRIIAFQRGQVAYDGSPQALFRDRALLAQLDLDVPPAARAADALRKLIPELPPNLILLSDLLAVLPPFGQAGNGAIFDRKAAQPERTNLLVEVEGLHHTYLKGTQLAHRALNGVSLKVYEGQAHGLLGRTGSGKSTLMQHLNGLLRPQAGRVRVNQFDLNDLKLNRKDVVRSVGLVLQNPEAQFFEYFVGDEIAFGPKQFPVEEGLAERVRWAMEWVGLDFETYKDRPLFALSGGERRKVALASTLALKPEILLLDEPTAGLDPRSRLEILGKLSAMQIRGMTLVLSSHHMEDIALLAGGLTVFEKGQDVDSGAPWEVFERVEVLRQYGLEPPAATQVAQAMRARGWPIAPGVTGLGDLERAVEALRLRKP